MIIDASYSGQQFSMAVGQVVELRLPENPTTGFRWAVASGSGAACRLDDQGFEGPGSRPGQGGEHVWRLVGVDAGVCELKLAYRRSFFAASPSDSGFALHVSVK